MKLDDKTIEIERNTNTPSVNKINSLLDKADKLRKGCNK